MSLLNLQPTLPLNSHESNVPADVLAYMGQMLFQLLSAKWRDSASHTCDFCCLPLTDYVDRSRTNFREERRCCSQIQSGEFLHRSGLHPVLMNAGASGVLLRLWVHVHSIGRRSMRGVVQQCACGHDAPAPCRISTDGSTRRCTKSAREVSISLPSLENVSDIPQVQYATRRSPSAAAMIIGSCSYEYSSRPCASNQQYVLQRGCSNITPIRSPLCASNIIIEITPWHSRADVCPHVHRNWRIQPHRLSPRAIGKLGKINMCVITIIDPHT